MPVKKKTKFMVFDSVVLYYHTPITHIAGTAEFGGNCVVKPRRADQIPLPRAKPSLFSKPLENVVLGDINWALQM